MGFIPWDLDGYVVDDDFAIGEIVDNFPHDMLEVLVHCCFSINVICVSP